MNATCPVQHLRDGLPELPDRVRALPVDERGYPVPWFVDWIDGKPEFRAMDGRKLVRAVKEKLCWVCGQPLGRNMAFVIGPMCAINRVSSEPPSHLECALFSAKACPFLTKPHMVRRENNMPPEEEQFTAGIAIKRNPGVSLVWVTRYYKAFPPPGGGVLFQIGEPIVMHCFFEGRRATPDEIRHSIKTGLPTLEETARAQGPIVELELKTAIERGMRLLGL